MGGLHCPSDAGRWRLTAFLACLTLLAAAPAAVIGELMSFTEMRRSASVTVTREVVQGQASAAGASSFASAQRSLPVRITAFPSRAAASQPSGSSQKLASEAASFTSYPLGGCPQTNFALAIELSHVGTIAVSLSSGSADFAVASTACDASCSGVPVAFPFEHPGDTDYVTELRYGDADLFGGVFEETVQLQGLPAVELSMLAITTQKGLIERRTCAFGQYHGLPRKRGRAQDLCHRAVP
jgi:hypothetical protein